MLNINFSRRNLIAIPIFNFWQGVELCYLLNLCNYIYISAPHSLFVRNSSSEYYVNILQDLKDYGTTKMKVVKLVIVFEKA